MGSTDIIIEGPDKNTVIELFAKQEIIVFKTGRRSIEGTIKNICYEHENDNNFYILILNQDEEYQIYYDYTSQKGIVTSIDRNKKTLCFKCKIPIRPAYSYCPNCGTKLKDHPTYFFNNDL
jgi:hypothetical protein